MAYIENILLLMTVRYHLQIRYENLRTTWNENCKYLP